MALTLRQAANVLLSPVNLRSTSWRVTDSQGNPLLHLRVTATGVFDVPVMFLKWMSDIFTLDDPCD